MTGRLGFSSTVFTFAKVVYMENKDLTVIEPPEFLGYVNLYDYGIGKLYSDFSAACTYAALCKSSFRRMVKYYSNGDFTHINLQEFALLDGLLNGQKAVINIPSEGVMPRGLKPIG